MGAERIEPELYQHTTDQGNTANGNTWAEAKAAAESLDKPKKGRKNGKANEKAAGGESP